ncbi:hypothetical protein K1719_019448 [Acacia pycnantha]|nr:hypothetical protein K1719_019448 [Acacia pycnantha]
MMEEELERMKEASQTDPSIVVQPPARPPRHQKWKAARMKGDKYVNADVAEVAHKIDSLEQQNSQGSFTPATRMDILSTAIGKPDYLDVVRGEPRGVSVAKYFGRCSPPIIEGGHWTLVVVCPAKNACYWLDSLGGKPDKDIKTMFAEDLKTYRQLIGSKDQGGPKWYYPKFPRQPGNTECGYYVINHMHAIVSTGRLTGFQNFFDSSVAPFSDEEVDTIRDVSRGKLYRWLDMDHTSELESMAAHHQHVNSDEEEDMLLEEIDLKVVLVSSSSHTRDVSLKGRDHHNKNRASVQKASSWITAVTFPGCFLLSNYRPYSSLCNEQRSFFSIWLPLLGMLNFTAFLSSLFICGAHFTRLHVISALLLISAMLIIMNMFI